MRLKYECIREKLEQVNNKYELSMSYPFNDEPQLNIKAYLSEDIEFLSNPHNDPWILELADNKSELQSTDIAYQFEGKLTSLSQQPGYSCIIIQDIENDDKLYLYYKTDTQADTISEFYRYTVDNAPTIFVNVYVELFKYLRDN